MRVRTLEGRAPKAGCDFLDTLYKVVIPGDADIVIISPGGYLSDINLYQAQKRLTIKHAVGMAVSLFWWHPCKGRPWRGAYLNAG